MAAEQMSRDTFVNLIKTTEAAANGNHVWVLHYSMK